MVVTFYEKPGCSTNAKQKKSLIEAGCMLIERNLLDNGLSKSELYEFLDDVPTSQWFNLNAPKIKKGEIDTAVLFEDEILELFMNEPILINRPLLIIDGNKMCGFNQEKIENLLNVKLYSKISNACTNPNN